MLWLMEKNFFVQTVKYGRRTYDNVRKIEIGQGDGCTTGCLLRYVYLKIYYEMIAIDISKQEALDANP